MRLRLAVLGAIFMAFIAAYAARPAHATYPGANGRIVFASGAELWSMQPDGSQLTLLTTVAPPRGTRVLASFPSFSANGSRLAVLVRELGRPAPCDPHAINAQSGVCSWVVVMNADGSGQRFVYGSEDIASLSLALSPDGSQVAFTKVTSELPAQEQLFTVDTDGRHLRLLTRMPNRLSATDVSPTWSPDGRTIAFASSREQAVRMQDWALFSVDTRTRRIAPVIAAGHDNDQEPNWSPDGSKLAFTRIVGSDFRIYSVLGDGSGEHELLQGATSEPVWSPDGNQIAYASQGLSVADADGSNPHVIFSGSFSGFDWQPIPN